MPTSSLNHLPTSVSYFVPASHQKCAASATFWIQAMPLKWGWEENHGAMRPAEMQGGSTRRKLLAWTCGGNVAFFFVLYLCGLNIHADSFTLKVLTITSLLTVDQVIPGTDTTCNQILASLCSGAAPSTWSAAVSLNTCKTLPLKLSSLNSLSQEPGYLLQWRLRSCEKQEHMVA